MTGKLTIKGRQTRQRIVAAAAELMFKGGVAGTTMEDVRAAARVSNSQIYHYFADKEALVRAVIEYQNETIVGGQEPMFAATRWPACAPGVTSWWRTSLALLPWRLPDRLARQRAGRGAPWSGPPSRAGSAGGGRDRRWLPGHA